MQSSVGSFITFTGVLCDPSSELWIAQTSEIACKSQVEYYNNIHRVKLTYGVHYPDYAVTSWTSVLNNPICESTRRFPALTADSDSCFAAVNLGMNGWHR